MYYRDKTGIILDNALAYGMHFMHCLAFVNRNYTHVAKDPTLDFDHAATTPKSASIPPQNTRLILYDAAKERLRIYRAKYYKQNREKILASNRKSQAKLKGKPGRKPGRPKGKPGRKPGRKPAARSNLSAKERLRIYRAKYYKQNKAKILAQNRKYQVKSKPAKRGRGKTKSKGSTKAQLRKYHREYARKYYKANRAKILSKNRKRKR